MHVLPENILSITRRLLFAVIALTAPSLSLGSDSAEWIARILPERISTLENGAASAGTIDGGKYVLALVDIGRAENEFQPSLVLAKVSIDNRYEPIFVRTLGSLLGLNVSIKNNSLFIRVDNAHHGIYFTRYQFKLHGGRFVLVGLESQSMTLKDSTDCRTYQKEGRITTSWSGASENLLMGKATYWAREIYTDEGNVEALKSARKKFDASKRPSNVVARTIVRHPRRLYLLSEFSPEEFPPYDMFTDRYAYYFDCNLKFQRSALPL